MSEYVTEAHPDLGYIFRFKPRREEDGGCYWTDVWVYEIVSYADPEEDPPVLEDYTVHSVGYRKPGANSMDNLLDADRIDEENAAWMMKGYIKWDGCSNMEFDNRVHICGFHDARKFSEMIARLWDRCGKVAGYGKYFYE